MASTFAAQGLHSACPASASHTIIDLFEARVLATPDAIAIVFEEIELSFRQLGELANQFANAMIEAGLSKGQTVGLCIDRRPEAIASMLGAFKIGAVYVSLDPEYPVDRVRYMIRDAALRVIVTHDLNHNALATQLVRNEGQGDDQFALPWIDSASDSFLALSTTVSLDLPSRDDLAYIMYTSGSTGMPKGVQIEHGSLATYCDADAEVYKLTASDRTLQFSTLNFDIAIEEIFPPLLTGGCVVIRPQTRSASGNELSAIIDQYQVTAIHIATAYWHEWVDLMIASRTTVPESLRLVIATGEKISVPHYRRWKRICHPNVLWCNAYGPTETTVTCTAFIPGEDFDQDHMPIGKPLPGYEAFILDEANRPVSVGTTDAPGQTGALFIAGPALARGYHNHPAKTEAAFIHVDLPGRGMTRIYRTGDLARWLPNGDIEFAGRVDHQIKVGSYRIEPGEIEVAIAQFPGVLESIVVHEEIAGQKYLIAYVAVGRGHVEPRELLEYLRTVLPVYMLPPRYVMLESLPKTINGKIDRKSLPAPETSQSVSSVNASSKFVAPRSETERRLREVWKSVLRLPTIDVHDDFFALGGSSLLVTRVVASVTSDFGVELPVRDFFANPTIATSANHIDQLLARKNQADGNTRALPTSTAAHDELRQRLPHIEAAMIPCESGQLFSVRYQPKSKHQRHGVLICNSIGHEHVRAFRNLQQLAMRLADRGYEVLRFDYRGTGNSSGSCDACTAESFMADTQAAAAWLRESSGVSRLSIIGVRLGATIAACAGVPDVDRMILWDPVVSGQAFCDLLDSMHHHVLSSQTRFVKRMKRSKIGQAYGHAMNDSKRSSLKSLSLNACDAADCRAGLLLYSREGRSLGDESINMNEQWCTVDTVDEIHWDQVDMAERAFSSPSIYKQVISFLDAAPPSSVDAPPLIFEKTGIVGTEVGVFLS